MKVSRITIKDFHQFKDLDLDLTYPAGHPKAGKPLDKVCFIGQSGTGKTTLLEMIPLFTSRYHTKSFPEDSDDYLDKISVSISYGHNSEFNTTVVDKLLDFRIWSWDESHTPKYADQTREYDPIEYYNLEWTKKIASKIVYLPANLNFEIDDIEDPNYSYGKIVDFSKSNVSAVWNLILDSIQKYHEQELQIRQDISKAVEQAPNDLDGIRLAVNKLEQWKKSQFNPIADVADNCLDALLANFKLRVKREFNFNTKGDIGFIKIEDFNKNEIPHHLWSTGTKQIVLSSLPLYLLKPQHTIILIDEPERSLYPDLQRLIINYYASLTKGCQFFYSTHSPIIAASFEPWEIVELKFNEAGQVYRDAYYEGENHVDNYFIDPRYLDYDLILKKVFDMKDTNADLRTEAIVEITMLKNQIDQLKAEGKLKTKEAKDIIIRYKNLANKLAWKTE
ncbi:AAA ATPase domain-containing protein [Chitinophaga jiangningensis]|uniref:AAA ATPase domain-containing protein n=1 Tax=Chitinophaga jiangningensis TaxID=1419482 RepID=A0A1M7M7Q7_9BACT|nr:AAA family ATPase [Chitinophaga jiangningensis]SHM86772.1 AAA ATPase domain-containing protein [Chitinophaga jiangningensis]